MHHKVPKQLGTEACAPFAQEELRCNIKRSKVSDRSRLRWPLSRRTKLVRCDTEESAKRYDALRNHEELNAATKPINWLWSLHNYLQFKWSAVQNSFDRTSGKNQRPDVHCPDCARHWRRWEDLSDLELARAQWKTRQTQGSHSSI